MRTNYRVVRGLPEKKELAIVLLHKLHDLGVAHETNTQLGEQCIHLAARISSPELLKAYIPIIKDINVLDNEKRNALQGICTSFDFEGPHQYNWKILISAGADALNCDVRGCSIADTIERFADQKISQYMKDHFLRDIKEASLRKTIEVDVKLAPKVKI